MGVLALAHPRNGVLRMKKTPLIYSFFAVLMGSALIGAAFSTPALAGCNDTFFGIPSWCRGLVNESDGNIDFPVLNSGSQDSLQKFIWTVVGNISDGIFRIIGVVSVAFIIWAGYQYMIALGDSGKMARAKTTLANAIIGLVISILASSIVNLIMGVF